MAVKAAKTTKKTSPAADKKVKAARPRTLKAVKTAAAPTVDDNLKKLAKSTIPMNFVKAHNGSWNHQDWLDFLAEIAKKGFDPIDPDRVGLILEDRKATFFANR